MTRAANDPAGMECPQCGAEVPAGRLACRECGSDASTGWKSAEEIDYQAVELPDEGGGEQHRFPAVVWWVVVAALAALVFAIAGLR
ncbi:MAG TPA: hypothetical protein VK081_11615 [Planctomycetota bacterium]|nr:hypothetical protein [Planctomycetota bacterium]